MSDVELSARERDVLIEASHPSRPDREPLIFAAVERIIATRLAAAEVRAEVAERERDEARAARVAEREHYKRALAYAQRKVAAVAALCDDPSGEREWQNQGRRGWTDVVDVDDLRAALDTAAVPDTPTPPDRWARG